MKQLISTVLLQFSFIFLGSSQITPVPSPRKVQVAILFDTSNSMDGLIDQAKSRIWSIVNEMSGLLHQGQTPTIEIALYDYGNSGLSAETNYIRLQTELTTDLDLISEKLFSLRTNGGDEFCGAVISKSLQELKWSSHPLDLRMIYIAGNEPFNQGSVAYKEACSAAASKDIFVNTIYCGDYNQGIREFWQDCASLSKGDYFNINSNEAVKHIATPYDASINQYNDSLNRTYYGYGYLGETKKSSQMAQDANAASQSEEVMTERAIVKSKGSYNNASWDLIDAVVLDKKNVLEMKDEELPEEFRGKTEKEKLALVEKIKTDREAYQQKIGELAKQRQEYIESEKQKMAGMQTDDFGSSVTVSIRKKAEELGYTFVGTK